MFRCCFALLFDHFILCFLLFGSLCLLVRFYYFTRIWVLHTHTPSTHYYFHMVCSVPRNLSHYLHRSVSGCFDSCFPSSSFGLGVFGSNCVPRSFQPLLCVYCVLLSFSSIKAKYMVLFKHVAQCVCELVCIYLERFHHVLSYAHILIKRKIIAHKKCK